jgi:hypothetical protein
MPRFVLLLHQCPDRRPRPTHCDLMLEKGDVLETWALVELPCGWIELADDLQIADSNTISVERLADHRLAYLDYEGPVSGDRGSVRRLDTGTFKTLSDSQTHALVGELIRGRITLQPSSDPRSQWQLVFTAE